MLGEQGRAVNEIHNGLKVAIEVRPTMLEELLTKGMFRSVEDFFALCEQIKGLDPYNEFTYRYAAAVMWDSGNIGASLQELDEGIELTLGTQALVMRGELLRQFGQARATGYFAMALVLDPHNEVWFVVTLSFARTPPPTHTHTHAVCAEAFLSVANVESKW